MQLQAQSPFDSLPNEIFEHIFSFLNNPSDFCHVSRVSKLWKSLSERMWKDYCTSKLDVSEPKQNSWLMQSRLIHNIIEKKFESTNYIVSSNQISSGNREIDFTLLDD